ncbi:MAG: alginate lyase family protein [Chitinophagaceae bacterium]|nr:alginate lyase family protein [Chitinophagaceae bacterium]
MTGRLKWYYSRLSTMNLPEVLFRAGQMQQRVFEKLFPPKPFYQQAHVKKLDLDFSFPGYQKAPSFLIFGHPFVIDEDIDFHKDFFSGKSFPLTFSKTIDIRSDKFGSAKAVWEVNRLGFLLPLLIEYKTTGEKEKLDLFVSIMDSWARQNPYLKGINWYSNIEVNLRLINWYWCWILLEKDERWQKEQEYKMFRDNTWLPLIYSHCVYSARNPSYHSSANNHLIAEYAGLFIASTIWKFDETPVWLKKSRRGLEREIQKQHSENGVNKEEASGYIQFITDMFLLSYIAAEHAGIAFSAKYTQTLKAICHYINNLLDMNGNHPKYGDEDDARIIVPDGDTTANNFISILNTAAVLFSKPEFKRFGAAWDAKSQLLTTRFNGHSVWKQFNYHRSSCESAFYEKEGHFIMRKHLGADKEIYCHFDAAPLGYLSIAAHGHADALSVILHLDGYPFLVDPGTYAYHTHAEWRKYFVSTLAHNTVTINGEDQAQLSGPTLWLNHYTSSPITVKRSNGYDMVSAVHDGYRRHHIGHKRIVEFNRIKDYFRITDEITATKPGYTVNMPFHLHPEVYVMQATGNTYILGRKETPTTLELIFDPAINTTAIEATDESTLAWYSPSFMIKERSTVLMGEYASDKQTLTLNTYIKIINRP